MRPRVLIYDYGCGNHGSLFNWLELSGFAPEISSNLDHYPDYKIVVLPGVGDINTAMNSIRNHGHYDLIGHIFSDPNILLIGICLGFQLFSRLSEESHSDLTQPFSLLPLTTLAIHPYVGWRQLSDYPSSLSLLRNLSLTSSPSLSAEVFFNHSYAIYTSIEEPSDILRPNIIYGSPLPSPNLNASHRPVNYFENSSVIGMQFHPERSQSVGLNIGKYILSKIS